MPSDDTRRTTLADLPDEALWRVSCMMDAAADEAAHFLDLAGFADGCLDPDERDRVADRLARDPVAAGDVAAARALAAAAVPEAIPETILARACGLVSGGAPESGKILIFRPRVQARVSMRVQGMARWGSLVAAVAVAGWLGFTLGVDASLSFTQGHQTAEESPLQDLLAPTNVFSHDPAEGART